MRIRARLDSLEARVGAARTALVLPDGSRVLYTPDEALNALHAAIGDEEEPLLARFLEAETTEGLPGLCRALVGSRERVRGKVGRLRGRVGRLERETAADVLEIRHPDGSISRFHRDAVMECFLHEMERGRRHHFGEKPGGAHALTVALRTATNLEDLMSEEGTVLGLFVGEDEIIRGVRERAGPPVEEAEPGVYS